MNDNRQQWQQQVEWGQQARQVLEQRHHLEECRDLWGRLLAQLDSLDPQHDRKALVFRAKFEAVRDLISGLESLQQQGEAAAAYLDGEPEPKGAMV